MSSFNKVIAMGNLTRDPDLRFLPNNTAVCDVGLAINEKYKSKQTGEMVEQVNYVDCTAFGKTAENIARFFTKGKPILVEGKLRFEQWEDKNSGQKRSKLKVVIDNWQFVGGKKDGDGGGQSQGRGGQRAAPPPNSEDIPF